MNTKKYFKSFLLLLLISTIMASAILFICECVYYINDDVFISMIASGVYGQEYSHCLIYSKSILGWIIKILNFFYRANYYMIFQYIFIVVSSALFAAIVIKKSNNMIISIISLIIWWATLFINIFTTITFTTVAGTISLIGLLGAFTFFNEDRVLTIVSILVAIFGYIYRDKAFLLTIPFVMLYIWINRDIILARQTRRKLITVLISILLCIFTCEIVDIYTYRSKEWKDFVTQIELKTKLIDYDCRYNVNDLDIKWSNNDDVMLRSMRHDNPEVFGNNNLQEIVNNSVVHYKSIGEVMFGVVSFFTKTFTILQIVLMIILLLISIICGKQYMLHSLLCFVIAILIISYFLYIGRFPWRVSYIIMFGIVTLLYLSIIENSVRFNSVVIKLCLLLSCVLLIFQIAANKKGDNRDYFDPFKQIRSDLNHFYVVDTIASTELPKIYRPYELIPQNLMENSVLVGGWLSNSPISQSVCKKQGATNALDILANREDVFFVTFEKDDSSKLIETYLREHNNINTKAILVEKIGGGYLSYIFKRQN